jgi:hypothetical protein
MLTSLKLGMNNKGLFVCSIVRNWADEYITDGVLYDHRLVWLESCIIKPFFVDVQFQTKLRKSEQIEVNLNSAPDIP